MYVPIVSFITTRRGARASEQNDGREIERATRRRGVFAEQGRNRIVRGKTGPFLTRLDEQAQYVSPRLCIERHVRPGENSERR